MTFQIITGWITGSENQTEIIKIYNIACFIATLFCLMAAIESTLAQLSPILIINNFAYSFILALSFYLSRFKQKFGISRNISVFVLLFIYTPILWVYNGGSASGIPYYFILFASFLTILSICDKDSKRNKKLHAMILATYMLVTTGLVILEFARPGIFYQFEDQNTRMFDTVISMLFALIGNFAILWAFINLYYKQLDQIKDYSERLEGLVIRDSMTNLYNHAYIFRRLTEEINKSARYHSPLSLLMIDIDHFKRINDSYGHAFGDEVLIKIAVALQTGCRNVDVVARYGGEEFLIVFPETGSASAAVTVRRLQENIRSLQYSQNVTVTISGGIAEYGSGDSASSMIERCDALLYRAKNDGRDLIRVE